MRDDQKRRGVSVKRQRRILTVSGKGKFLHTAINPIEMSPAISKGDVVHKVSNKASVLVAAAILLGIIPQLLIMFGIRDFLVGLTFFLLNIALCAFGFMSRKFRIFWSMWSLASVAFFLLFGIATPVGMVLALPRLM